jgi:hypothetical protein
MKVRDIARVLVETASNATSGVSRLSRLRKELRNLKASEKSISATFDPETTRLSNNMQKERRLQRENEGINYPDHFALESVKERLGGYDVSKIPDTQALTNIMVMLCIRPAELKTIRIADVKVTGYVKNRNQEDLPPSI